MNFFTMYKKSPCRASLVPRSGGVGVIQTCFHRYSFYQICCFRKRNWPKLYLRNGDKDQYKHIFWPRNSLSTMSFSLIIHRICSQAKSPVDLFLLLKGMEVGSCESLSAGTGSKIITEPTYSGKMLG